MPTMSTAVSQSSQTGFSPMQGEDQRHSIPGTTSDKVQPRPSHSHSHSDDLDPVTADSSGTEYPPQKHAGKTGLGPHYYEEHRATFQDKVHGLREELEGEIKHNEKLWQVHYRIHGDCTLTFIFPSHFRLWLCSKATSVSPASSRRSRGKR